MFERWEDLFLFSEVFVDFLMYSWEHGISHTNLYVIKKKLSSLSFIVIIINHDICDHD
jgi:hypothetical protein